jgi:hypothetical protein
MADVPLNERLYAMVVSQAKAKYRIYPSPGASHWVHQRYLELGGRFEDSEKIAERKAMMRRAIEHRRELAEKRRGNHGDDE